MAWFEAVLRRRRVERGAKDRKEHSFQDFYLRTEKRDRAIGRALVGRFARFEDRDDVGRLPYCRDVSGLNRQVKQMGGVADAQWAKVLQMEHREIIWASSWRIFARLYSVDCVGVGERGEIAVQRVT